MYINKNEKVKIRCRICDKIFTVRVGHHLYDGSGCPHCSGSLKKTTEMFVSDCARVHNEVYDYSKVIYNTRHSRVIIGCRTCGLDFEQEACVHLAGSGCSYCCGHTKLNTLTYTTKAKAIHGELYDYSRVDYKTAKNKIEIGCRRCGQWFKQIANNHLSGRGCRRCVRQSFVSIMETSWLDSLKIPNENRQAAIKGLRYDVDALVDRTVYEFYGKYFHGDPRVYAADVWNERNKNTMGKLYAKTLQREQHLQELGYNVRFVWEVDYLNGLSFSLRHPHECLEIMSHDPELVVL